VRTRTDLRRVTGEVVPGHVAAIEVRSGPPLAKPVVDPPQPGQLRRLRAGGGDRDEVDVAAVGPEVAQRHRPHQVQTFDEAGGLGVDHLQVVTDNLIHDHRKGHPDEPALPAPGTAIPTGAVDGAAARGQSRARRRR
jgi:hypothetical protein